MVRIVDEGPDPIVVKKVVCSNCGARLEYVPADVKKRRGKDYDGGSWEQDWFECPKCKEDVIVRSL